jgi:hypothetical protein
MKRNCWGSTSPAIRFPSGRPKSSATTASSREVGAAGEGSEVTLGAMIADARKRVTKNGRSAGQQMAILTLEDLDGQIEATIFAESLAEILKRRPGPWRRSRSSSSTPRKGGQAPPDEARPGIA